MAMLYCDGGGGEDRMVREVWMWSVTFGERTPELTSACMITCQEPNWPIKCTLSQWYAKTILHSQNLVVNTSIYGN